MSNYFIFSQGMKTTCMRDVLNYRLWTKFNKLKYVVFDNTYLLPPPPHHFALFIGYNNARTRKKAMHGEIVEEFQPGKNHRTKFVLANIKIYWREYILPAKYLSRFDKMWGNEMKKSPQGEYRSLSNEELKLVIHIKLWKSMFVYRGKLMGADQIEPEQLSEIVKYIEVTEEYKQKYKIPSVLLQNVRNSKTIKSNYEAYAATGYFDGETFNLIKLHKDHKNGLICPNTFQDIKTLSYIQQQDSTALKFLESKQLTQEQFQQIYKTTNNFIQTFKYQLQRKLEKENKDSVKSKIRDEEDGGVFNGDQDIEE